MADIIFLWLDLLALVHQDLPVADEKLKMCQQISADWRISEQTDGSGQ